MITEQQLTTISGRPINDNAWSFLLGVQLHGAAAGLDRPHRLAHLIAQVLHESRRFRYDRELWGATPTPAQARYDVRADLGNTPQRDGDGYLYRGRGPLQVTGAGNVKEYYAWCRAHYGDRVPNFVEDPDAINTDPWEGLSCLWFWATRMLNTFADAGEVADVTRVVNGGPNGLADREALYARAALVFLGHPPEGVKAFQAAAGLKVDGQAGPKTQAALHRALTRLPSFAPKPTLRPTSRPRLWDQLWQAFKTAG